jgi:hypothetical protein
MVDVLPKVEVGEKELSNDRDSSGDGGRFEASWSGSTIIRCGWLRGLK